jgi:hypothetical protein
MVVKSKMFEIEFQPYFYTGCMTRMVLKSELFSSFNLGLHTEKQTRMVWKSELFSYFNLGLHTEKQTRMVLKG